jgi:hypothetical protein
MANKKQNDGFEDKIGPFWKHGALRSSLTVLTKIGWPLGSDKSYGMCCMLNKLFWTNTNYVIWLSTVQTKIVYMSMLFLLFYD